MKTEISNAEKLKSFISEVTFTDIENVKEDTLIFDEGLFDSLGFLSLIGFLEEEFNIEVENDELTETNFESINAIVAFINSRKETH